MRIFREIYFQVYAPLTVRMPKETPDLIKGQNYGQNSDLVKVKLNIGMELAVYDIFTQNLIIDVIPVVYCLFPLIILINMWFCTL